MFIGLASGLLSNAGTNAAAHAAAAAAVARLSFTGDAQQVIERDALYTLVYEQSLAGNWGLLYEAHFFTFTNTANALVGVKLGTAAVNSGTPTHSANGVVLDASADAVDLNYAFSEIGATNRGYIAGTMFSAYTPHATSTTQAFQTALSTTPFSYTGISYQGDDQKQFTVNINNAGGGGLSPVPKGLSNTIVGDLIAVAGTAGANTDPQTFYRGNRVDTGTFTTLTAYLTPPPAKVAINAARLDAGAPVAAASTVTSLCAFTALVGFNYASWRSSVLRFMRATGAYAEAGRMRAVIFGDSNSDSNVGYATNYWWKWLGTNTVLDTTGCTSGKGLATNVDGSTADTVLTRVQTFCAGWTHPTANTIIVAAGGNDFYAIAENTADATTATNAAIAAINTIVTEATKRGLAIYFVGMYPVSWTHLGGRVPPLLQFYDPLVQNARTAIDAHLTSLAAAGTIKLINTNAIKGDPILGYEAIRIGYNIDNAHLDQDGHTAFGISVAEQISVNGTLVGGTGVPA